MYTTDMGGLEKTNVSFRPYGTKTKLKCRGSFPAMMKAQAGCTHPSKVYVVEGHLAEPLLGRLDAQALGIITFDENGKTPQEPVRLVANDLQAAGITIKADKETTKEAEAEEKVRIEKILSKHGSAFSGIGLLKGEKVKFDIDPTIKPVADAFRGVPLAYQQRLSDHLQVLRDNDKIEDVDPTNYHGWQSNVVISEKTTANKIRMNVDMRNANDAIESTT